MLPAAHHVLLRRKRRIYKFSIVDPDSTYNPDADQVSDFYLMQIRTRILFDADADPDPGYHNTVIRIHVEPYPQHCLYLQSPPILPPPPHTHTLSRSTVVFRFWVCDIGYTGTYYTESRLQGFFLHFAAINIWIRVLVP